MAKKKKFNHLGRYLTSALILGSAIGLLVAMKFMWKAPEESDNDNSVQIVSVFAAQEFTGQLEIEVSGLVEPHREIEMASQVAGDVQEKSEACCAGNFVRAGTPLLTIDSTSYDLALQRTQAEKAQAEASIVELEQELSNLNTSIQLVQNEYDLQLKEFERKMRAGAALSASERDQAKRSLNTAERQLTELKNNRQLSESRRARLQTAIDLSIVRLKEAQLNKDRCVFKAPFDGVVVSDPVERGDYVSMGETVLVFEDTDKVDVTCNLRFEQLQQIVKYQIPDSRFTREPHAAYQLPPTAVDILRNTEDGRTTTWSGMLSRFDGIGVDVQTKMIPCRVIVDDPVSMEGDRGNALVRGMFVTVNIPLDVFVAEGESLLTFPAIALRPGNRVWTVVDGKLVPRKVEILDRKNTDAADPRQRMVVARISSDLIKAGDMIVTSPLAQPTPGTDVTIQEKTKEEMDQQETMEDGDDETTTGSGKSDEAVDSVHRKSADEASDLNVGLGAPSVDVSADEEAADSINAGQDKGAIR